MTKVKDDSFKFRLEETINESNRYNELLSSFNNVCTLLEAEANKNMKLADGENELIMIEKQKVSDEFSKYLTNLHETCDKIMLKNMCLKTKNSLMLTKQIEIPYDIQSDSVSCLKEVYNPPLEEDCQSDEVVKVSDLESISNIIKTIENNINEIEDFQILYSLK